MCIVLAVSDLRLGYPYDYVSLLAESGVDTLVMNVNASKAYYPSRVVETILDGYTCLNSYTRGDREFVATPFPPTNDTDFAQAMLDEHLNFQTIDSSCY